MPKPSQQRHPATPQARTLHLGQMRRPQAAAVAEARPEATPDEDLVVWANSLLEKNPVSEADLDRVLSDVRPACDAKRSAPEPSEDTCGTGRVGRRKAVRLSWPCNAVAKHRAPSEACHHGILASVYRNAEAVRQDFCKLTPPPSAGAGDSRVCLPSEVKAAADVVASVSGRVCREGRPIVLLQVSDPGRPFARFAAERHKVVLSADAYLRLLDWFPREYGEVTRLLDAEYARTAGPAAQQGEGAFYLHENAFIVGRPHVSLATVLDSGPDYELVLEVVKKGDSGQQTVSLHYESADAALGGCHLPPKPLSELCATADHARSLARYIEGHKSDGGFQSREGHGGTPTASV